MRLISAGYGGLYWDCSLADEKELELQYPLKKKFKKSITKHIYAATHLHYVLFAVYARCAHTKNTLKYGWVKAAS